MAQIEKKTLAQTYVHERGWGKELWVENCADYCGKILHVLENHRCSLHWHVNKLETMYLASGHVLLHMIDPETGKEYTVELVPGDSIQIPRNQPHQIHAVRESVIYEFSTMHEEHDSHRVRKGD